MTKENESFTFKTFILKDYKYYFYYFSYYQAIIDFNYEFEINPKNLQNNNYILIFNEKNITKEFINFDYKNKRNFKFYILFK